MKPGTESKYKILVVDDSQSIREVLAALLSLEGHLCESAANVREAMEKVTQAHFDIVITDVPMPEMDGITLTGELTRHFSDLPVMIMTGQPDDSLVESARSAGAREILRKPFSISELVARLHRMLPAQEPTQEQRA